MACTLYREGTGTIEHGIECESTTCEINHLEGLLNNGWSQDPPGYVPPEHVEAEDQGDLGISIGPDLHERLDALIEENKLLTELNEHLESEVGRLTEELRVASFPAGEELPDEEGVVTPDDVRAAAKEAGIEGWDTKRIATLQKALES